MTRWDWGVVAGTFAVVALAVVFAPYLFVLSMSWWAW